MRYAMHMLDGTEKLKELVLHICDISIADDAFGSIKLNKLLFFSDFQTFIATYLEAQA